MKKQHKIILLLCGLALGAGGGTFAYVSNQAPVKPPVEQKQSAKEKNESKDKDSSKKDTKTSDSTISKKEKKQLDKIIAEEKPKGGVGLFTQDLLGTSSSNQLASVLNEKPEDVIAKLSAPKVETTKPKDTVPEEMKPIKPPVLPEEKPVLPEIPEKPTPPVDPVDPLPPIVVESTPVIHLTHKGEVLLTKYSPFSIDNYYYVTDNLDSNPVVTFEGGIDVDKSGYQSVVIRVTNKFGNEASITFSVYVNAAPVLVAKQPGPVDIQIDDMDFDLFSVVRASDDEDGDLTDSIEMVRNTVNKTIEGQYEVEFKVTDSKGVSAYKTIRYNVTNEAPVFHFPKSVEHEINQPFNPLEGVTISDREDGEIKVTEDMVLENTVDYQTEGDYYVTYEVLDSRGKSSGIQRRDVKVRNEAPKILGTQDLEFHVNTVITKQMLLNGVTANDREDDKAGIPLAIVINEEQFLSLNTLVEGTMIVSYEVTDSMGATTIKTINIVIINDAPVIHGVLPNVNLEVGDEFNPLAGVTATDTETPSDKLQVHVDGLLPDGKFDTSVPGTYVLTYWTEDEQGKRMSVSSTVIVNEKAIEESETTPEETLVTEEVTEIPKIEEKEKSAPESLEKIGHGLPESDALISV